MKRLTLSVLIVLLLALSRLTTVDSLFRIDEDSKITTYYHGIRHTEIIGTIDYNDTESRQKINYMGANPTNFEDLNLVVGDNYLDYGWGMGDLATIITNVNNRYDNYTVIGGVNGDFYNMSTGMPIEAYVRNFEVLSQGIGVNRTVVGFKDDGTVVFGRPTWDGYEAIVFNDQHQIKHRFDLEGINTYPEGANGVTAFFHNAGHDVATGHPILVLSAMEIKHDDYGKTYFGKGMLNLETSGTVSLDPYDIALVGPTLNHDDLITVTDTVVIQAKMGGAFEGVRFAIGAWETLVKDGVVTEEHTYGAGPDVRHPRTAIGVKADGTVFFVTVDGRDYINGYRGVTAYELSELMFHFGAVDAYNLDGGGSTTMVVRDETDQYIYLNTPSDGQPRRVTNGLFFVEGQHEDPPVTLPWPDTRTPLDAPSGFAMENGILTFGGVPHATAYDIEVNGEVYTTLNPSYQLALAPGLHTIRVRAKGDYTDYQDSAFSPLILHMVYTDGVQDIVDWLKQQATKK